VNGIENTLLELTQAVNVSRFGVHLHREDVANAYALAAATTADNYLDRFGGS